MEDIFIELSGAELLASGFDVEFSLRNLAKA